MRFQLTRIRVATLYGDNATFVEAKDHAHLLPIEPGWQDIAEQTARWLAERI